MAKLFKEVHEIQIETGKLVYCEKPGGAVEILDISVQPHQRRKGIGTQLIQAVRHAIRRPNLSLHAVTRRENGVARCFYTSLGMFPVVIPGYYPDSDGILFVDKLRP